MARPAAQRNPAMAKGPGGRPKKAAAERRTQQRKLNLTIAEEAFIEEQAKTAGVTLAEFARRPGDGLGTAVDRRPHRACSRGVDFDLTLIKGRHSAFRSGFP